MQKSHKSAELPFNCGCCDYRSSSLRHTVDHFYSDHTASGTLQCPFCLKIYTIVANNEQITTNIDGYLEHLKQHMAKDSGARCTRCSLIFLHKGSNKLHQMYDHNSLKGVQSVLRECCKNTVSIPKPTVILNHFCCEHNNNSELRAIFSVEKIQYERANYVSTALSKFDHISTERQSLFGMRQRLSGK